jgi:hypothetical protein
LVRAGVSYALGRGFDSLLRHNDSEQMAATEPEKGHSVGHSDDRDPVEAALAAGVSAIAASMAHAAAGDLVTLADRMSALARELEARRLAHASNVTSITTAKRRSR